MPDPDILVQPQHPILSLLQDGDSMTDRAILDALNVQDVNNIRPEITRLKQKGLLEENGKIRCPTTGKTVRLIRIVKGD